MPKIPLFPSNSISNAESHLMTPQEVQQQNRRSLGLIGEFQKQAGRPLRILHIGNIANNAYNNACIQRQFGIEADVLCYNYYHIMGCPEWEDGAIQEGASALGQDHFKPDWWATSLRGWKRPGWFVQGPSGLCIEYLRARNARWRSTSYLKWLELELAAFQDARSADPGKSPARYIPARLKFMLWLKQASGQAEPGNGRRLTFYRIWLGSAVANGILGRDDTQYGRSEPTRLDRISAAAWLRMTRRGSQVDIESRAALAAYREDVRRLRAAGVRGLTKHWLERAASPARTLVERSLSLLERILRRLFPVTETGCVARSMSDPVTRAKEIETMLDEIRQDPAELDGQSLSYREEYITNHPRPFEAILSHYDVIQGYAIDGLIPMINGVKNFCCYEHGTLREIPFENNLTGLICRFSFQRAPAVFVTNSDVLPSVERLGLKPERVFYLPHAFDDRKLAEFRAAHPELAPPKSGPVIFFSPTRHHWKRGNTSWQKGNDVVIRAAAEIARERSDFKLVFVEWGQEVADSKELIEELGLTKLVEWIPTMSKRELWQRYCVSHAVVDQFVVPALGGVGFETMALGVRLISAIDRQQTALFFGEEPPCLAANSVGECAARMREVIEDPLDSRGQGRAASQWMTTFHSAERIVALQCKAYSNLLVGQW
ncbi:glycosyltransferase [Bradyrhizobium sp. 41S5]|uniref:glycosyltransferase n=1 Tax=Bradyrhizobium sp. 41S5 TaxID=1404443 RepID=UPI0015956AD4|nr:glycosyltransferase [Bradyrhizobium sp. 41S5]UFX47770.1 glycosyltransferase [Bradyrhizobium sp. 41S5]